MNYDLSRVYNDDAIKYKRSYYKISQMLVEDVSSNEILEDKSRETRDAPRTPPPPSLDMDTINELELMLDKSNPNDTQELGKILTEILNYPQSKIAETHK